ncbi:MAG TPA: transketolase family protein [Clostridia bacterium]|jgi:transketolase|nr:transketolase family protein [Clostridia bacterium]
MKKIATREGYGKALAKLGTKYPNMVVLDADLSRSTRSYEFCKYNPERFFNMGIAEQNLMGTAAGLAAAGKIVFASTFAIFATGRAFEQIRNSIAYPCLNVKIAASHAGLTVGADGASHQAIVDVAIMRALPNMQVIVPADAIEAEKAIWAVAAQKGPAYLRLGRAPVPVIYPEEAEFELGKATLLREGREATIIACGIMVAESLLAAEELAEEGFAVRVLNMSTLKPLDEGAILQAARETGALVTAEEHSIIGGLGSAVAEVVGENCPVPLERVGVKDVFGESGEPDELLEKYGLRAVNIKEAVRRVIRRK